MSSLVMVKWRVQQEDNMSIIDCTKSWFAHDHCQLVLRVEEDPVA